MLDVHVSFSSLGVKVTFQRVKFQIVQTWQHLLQHLLCLHCPLQPLYNQWHAASTTTKNAPNFHIISLEKNKNTFLTVDAKEMAENAG